MFDVNNEENFGGDITQEEGGTEEQFTTAQEDSEGQTDESNPTEGAEGTVNPKAQTDEENSKYAAARRQAEAEKKDLEIKYKREKELIKTYGAKYECYSDEDVQQKYGANGINNLEDLAKEVDRQAYIEKTGIDPTEIDKRVEEKMKNDPAYKEFQRARDESIFMKQIDSLVVDFPDLKGIVKSIPDLKNLPNSEEIINLVDKRGLTISDAYYLANKKDIVSGKSASAIQAAINNIKSKDHMKPTAGAGSPTSTVKIPPETMKMYKSWFPNWTEELIKKHYANQ